MSKFEVVNKYNPEDITLPTRSTQHSAGYDFYVAADTTLPPIHRYWEVGRAQFPDNKDDYMPLTISEVEKFTKEQGLRPTLVPTGVKSLLEEGQYLELSVRSSTPLKYWIIMANGVGIIDKDYYGNPANDGEIFFQLINLSPFAVTLKKGDKIGQGIIKRFETVEGDNVTAQRMGGFGSTSN